MIDINRSHTPHIQPHFIGIFSPSNTKNTKMYDYLVCAPYASYQGLKSRSQRILPPPPLWNPHVTRLLFQHAVVIAETRLFSPRYRSLNPTTPSVRSQQGKTIRTQATINHNCQRNKTQTQSTKTLSPTTSTAIMTQTEHWEHYINMKITSNFATYTIKAGPDSM